MNHATIFGPKITAKKRSKQTKEKSETHDDISTQKTINKMENKNHANTSKEPIGNEQKVEIINKLNELQTKIDKFGTEHSKQIENEMNVFEIRIKNEIIKAMYEIESKKQQSNPIKLIPDPRSPINRIKK